MVPMDLQLDAVVFILVTGGLVVPIVQQLKGVGLPSQWAPLASLAIASVLGLLGGLLDPLDSVNALQGLAQGLVGSAVANGLYSAQKAIRGA